MTYAIAAAGTGGHLFPGLAVAEALTASGVPADQVMFFGGNRMEAELVPKAGFDLVQVDIRGLQRSLSVSNLGLPKVVWEAYQDIRREIRIREVRVVLGMGGYITVPVGWAASREKAVLFLHEQNSHAGLANRIVRRRAAHRFLSFPKTRGLKGQAVGYPLRPEFGNYDKESLRPSAFAYYQLNPDIPIIGVFGGSQGSAAINYVIGRLSERWAGPPIQIVHLTGTQHLDRLSTQNDAPTVVRRLIGFEEQMDLFYAAADLVVARAGGGLFEIACTGTPTILIPGNFAGGHQKHNASAMEKLGASVALPEHHIDSLPEIVAGLLGDQPRRKAMAEASQSVALPSAAQVIASAMRKAGDGGAQ